jgi:hypothetical protein
MDVVFDLVATLLLLVAVLTALAAPFVAVLRWHGAWRSLALLPAGALTFVAARIVLDTSGDPTSHNLWPLELAFCSVPGLLFLAVLWVVRRVLGADIPAPRWR